MELDFEVDKLTESIENAETGEALETLILPVNQEDLSKVNKKNGWLFDWKFEFSQKNRYVYKLVTVKDTKTIHGLVSYKEDKGFMYMHLLESASFNRGKGKKYLGVAGNLVAHVCKTSMQCGFDGVISFHSKTALIEHYEKTLGAVHLGGGLMAIQEEDAKNLIDKYF